MEAKRELMDMDGMVERILLSINRMFVEHVTVKNFLTW